MLYLYLSYSIFIIEIIEFSSFYLLFPLFIVQIMDLSSFYLLIIENYIKSIRLTVPTHTYTHIDTHINTSSKKIGELLHVKTV